MGLWEEDGLNVGHFSLSLFSALLAVSDLHRSVSVAFVVPLAMPAVSISLLSSFCGCLLRKSTLASTASARSLSCFCSSNTVGYRASLSALAASWPLTPDSGGLLLTLPRVLTQIAKKGLKSEDDREGRKGYLSTSVAALPLSSLLQPTSPPTARPSSSPPFSPTSIHSFIVMLSRIVLAALLALTGSALAAPAPVTHQLEARTSLVVKPKVMVSRIHLFLHCSPEIASPALPPSSSIR